jgi:hypothetical protein
MLMGLGWARFIAIADKNVLAIVPFVRAYSQLLCECYIRVSCQAARRDAPGLPDSFK